MAAKQPRRANREGKPWQRSDGMWCARVYPPKGSIETKPQTVYSKTRAGVIKKRDALLKEWAKGTVTEPGITVGEYLARWSATTLDQYVADGTITDSTADSYRDMIRLHIIPYLGHLRLADELTPPVLREWRDLLLKKPSGRTPKKTRAGKPDAPVKTLSVRTVNYARAILHKAVADAITDEVAGLDTNVVDKLVPARDRKKESEPKPDLTITPQEATALLVAMAADDLWCYWLIAFALGYRRGEGLGMRWPDLDRDSRVWRPRYQVRRQRGEADPVTGKRGPGKLVLVELKTAASRKPVGLPVFACRALDQWEAQQNGVRATAETWANLGLVFTTRFGTALEPRNVNRAWEKVCKRAGVRYIKPHDLRHACGSYLVHAGVDLKSVQDALRHARLSTTTRFYLHALETVSMTAADAMDLVLEDLGAVVPVSGRETPFERAAAAHARLSPGDRLDDGGLSSER